MNKIHIIPSGRFAFHEDDFSSAEFYEDPQWFVGVFFFRSTNGGKRAETRLTGKDARDLQYLLDTLQRKPS